jgi:lipopolysaccharide/colanic/teichoic acid biosynthesis glycosyltransferase
MLIRFFDIFFSSIGLILLGLLILVLIITGYFDTGDPVFKQERVGKNQRSFTLFKLRTMQKDAPSVASHKADRNLITPYGRILRRTKLDELPQLWNVLLGEMSLVGPRPCLPSQFELIQERNNRNIFDVRPGITGLAQIQNIDMSTPKLLAVTEAKMLKDYKLKDYFKYLILTIMGGGKGDAIK